MTGVRGLIRNIHRCDCSPVRSASPRLRAAAASRIHGVMSFAHSAMRITSTVHENFYVHPRTRRRHRICCSHRFRALARVRPSFSRARRLVTRSSPVSQLLPYDRARNTPTGHRPIWRRSLSRTLAQPDLATPTEPPSDRHSGFYLLFISFYLFLFFNYFFFN